MQGTILEELCVCPDTKLPHIPSDPAFLAGEAARRDQIAGLSHLTLADQSRIIKRVGDNTADEYETLMFEEALRSDNRFCMQIIESIDKCENGCTKCCCPVGKGRRAARLRAAIRRVLGSDYRPEEDSRLLPPAPPLLAGDRAPRTTSTTTSSPRDSRQEVVELAGWQEARAEQERRIRVDRARQELIDVGQDRRERQRNTGQQGGENNQPGGRPRVARIVPRSAPTVEASSSQSAHSSPRQ